MYTEHLFIQWNFSNRDTNGAEKSVIVSEVKCMQEWYILGVGKVSCSERCPQFGSVLMTVLLEC